MLTRSIHSPRPADGLQPFKQLSSLFVAATHLWVDSNFAVMFGGVLLTTQNLFHITEKSIDCLAFGQEMLEHPSRAYPSDQFYLEYCYD